MEDRYMLDEQYSELRDEVELALVDAYVGDTLTLRQRDCFENHYLITPERKRAVQAAWLSKAYRDRVALPPVKQQSNRWRMLQPWLLGHRRLVPAMAAAMLLLAICAAEIWIPLMRNRSAKRHIGSLARKVNPPAPSVETSPGTVPPDAGQSPPTPRTAFRSKAQQPRAEAAPDPDPIPPTPTGAVQPEPPEPAPTGRILAAIPSAPPMTRLGVRSMTLPAGTPITIRTIDRIDSKSGETSREYAASLDDPLVVDGIMVAPAKASAVLRLKEVKRPSGVKGLIGRASLTVGVTALNIHGQTVNQRGKLAILCHDPMVRRQPALRESALRLAARWVSWAALSAAVWGPVLVRPLGPPSRSSTGETLPFRPRLASPSRWPNQ